MIADLRDKAVLVTGGTAGVGLATGLAFGAAGARCVLTYRWGSADEDELRARFAEVGAPQPLLVEADIGEPDDTQALMDQVADHFDHIEVLISNASIALVPRSFDDWSERGLLQSMHLSTWPMVAYTRAIRDRFGRYPRYVVAMSSDGPDKFAAGYDFVAASKSALETLCRYMTYHLRNEDVRINVLRSRSVRTASFESTFGAEMAAFADKLVRPECWVPATEVGNAALALCSGRMDAVCGQVLTVDRGTAFSDNLMQLFARRDELDLELIR